MRAIMLVALVAACTPEVLPGSYLCGPNKACPEGQACSDADNTCKLPSLVEPFACVSDLASEPDDTVETSYTLSNIACQTLPIVIDGCMQVDDSADWYQLTPPASCTASVLDARITFPVAFARIGLELVDVESSESLGVDGPCMFGGEGGEDLRCLTGTLAPGRSYAIRVAPTGEDDCDGTCVFNRYALRIQLAPE